MIGTTDAGVTTYTGSWMANGQLVVGGQNSNEAKIALNKNGSAYFAGDINAGNVTFNLEPRKSR